MEKLDSHINKYKELKDPHTGIGFGVIASSGASAGEVLSYSGATKTTADGYDYYRYNGDGSWSSVNLEVEVLLVGGGGNKGGEGATGGGGGGAVILTNAFTPTEGTLTVDVGAIGANSSFDGNIAGGGARQMKKTCSCLIFL